MIPLFNSLQSWFLSIQRDLPWRINRTPYRVWLSEIMLQQTQVNTVIDYYERFLTHFPTIQDLSHASEDSVLALWSGLGYYSRARNLHKTAQIISQDYLGEFPDTYDSLQKLPGIGSYTAGAILAFAFQKPAPVVDGNIARVLARLFNDSTRWGDSTGKKHFEKISLDLAQQVPDILIWQEGLMELGALLCKPQNPDCLLCPFQSVCLARQNKTIDQLPRKMSKPQKSRLDIVCALIHDENHIWLQKDQTHSLFKGLYAPPSLISSEQNKSQTLQKLLKDLGLSPIPSQSFLTIQRTLTHRNLYLHAKLIPMSSESRPSPHWVSRNLLNQIGLSAAVKNLLLHAALLNFILLLGCSHKNPAIRYITVDTSLETSELKSIKTPDYARSLLGKPYATLNNKKYRSDCSGTVKAIYDSLGKSLGNAEGSKAIYDYIIKTGRVDMNEAKKQDLVFFYDSDKKQLNHVGFVEEILADQTILFIHCMGGIIVRSRMNLKSPHLQLDPQTHVRLNHILKRVNSKKGYTAAQLFAGFGRL